MKEQPMSDEKTMGQVIQIDKARIRDHLGEIVSGTVNADLIFPKSAEVKFPNLAGMVINRSRDRRLHFLAADHAGAESPV